MPISANSKSFVSSLALFLMIFACSCSDKNTERSEVESLFNNSIRHKANALDSSRVLRTESGCTAYFVRNTQGRTLIGSAQHCFDYDVTAWCAGEGSREGALVDNEGRLGSCVQIIAAQKDRDITFFEAKFAYTPNQDQSLVLAAYAPRINDKLTMIGYPADAWRNATLTTTDHCWITSNTVLSPYRNDDLNADIFDLSSRHTCSTYGGNSGGPMILEGTDEVLGLPFTYKPDLYTIYADDNKSTWAYLAQMSGFIASNREALEAAGVVISLQPPIERVRNQALALDFDQQEFATYCEASERSDAERKTLRVMLKQYRSLNCQELARAVTQASEISLQDSQISDITALKYAKGAKAIYLARNEISDLTPLRDLKETVFLDVSHNKILDITPIVTMSELQTLNISNNSLEDIAPLAKLEKISVLQATSNRIKDIAGIQSVNLTYLDLSSNDIDDLSGLTTVLSLQRLRASSNRITKTAGISKLPRLTTLDLANNLIEDVSELELPSLQDLTLSGNRLRDISKLRLLVGLYNLDLSSNEIDNLPEQLPPINTFNLSNNRITSVDRLKDLIAYNLSLANNRINDITPLKNAIYLRQIDLGANAITEVTSLSSLKDLSYIGLTDTKVSDLTSLLGLEKIQILGVKGSPLAEQVCPFVSSSAICLGWGG